MLSLVSVAVIEVVLVTQSGPSLCNPMDFNLPGSSVHGILKHMLIPLLTGTAGCLSIRTQEGATDWRTFKL